MKNRKRNQTVLLFVSSGVESYTYHLTICFFMGENVTLQIASKKGGEVEKKEYCFSFLDHIK